MNENELKILVSVVERYLYHLQVEIIHTDKREFRNALKEREQFLKEMIDKFKTKLAE
jgi:hypothetical protein